MRFLPARSTRSSRRSPSITSPRRRSAICSPASRRSSGPVRLFVLADVVVPEHPEDVVTPIEAGYDLPDRLGDQLDWLREAGLAPEVVWAARDLAVVRATRL